MIWIIGEYAERIDNADELLEGFLEGFKDENSQVQLQLLTAIVKLFLKKPTETPQELVTRVLTLVTQVSSALEILPAHEMHIVLLGDRQSGSTRSRLHLLAAALDRSESSERSRARREAIDFRRDRFTRTNAAR